MIKNQRNIIVTGCDDNYFQLVKALILSIRDQASLNHIEIGFMDAGILNKNKTWLIENNIKFIELDFEDVEHKKRFRGRRSLLVNYYKPRLNLLFPEYDNIIFVDADTWVQTDQAFKYLLQASNQLKLGIVSQSTRLTNSVMGIRSHFFSRFFNRYEPRGILYKNGLRAKIPYRYLKTLLSRPVLNCGVYALNTRAPHWTYWQNWQKIVLKKGRVFTSDQLSLALAVDQHDLACELMPDTCNYIFLSNIRFDENTSLFTDRYIPYDPISIIHFAGINNRLEKDLSVACINQNNEIINKNIHYHAYEEC